jgi:glucose-induced degradation protein 8
MSVLGRSFKRPPLQLFALFNLVSIRRCSLVAIPAVAGLPPYCAITAKYITAMSQGAARGTGALAGDGNREYGAGGPGSGPRQLYTREDWDRRLAEAPVSKAQMNALVMNYLVIEGYKDAAECFRDEAGVDPGVDLATISDRMATRAALQRGDVQTAIERANELNPLILDENDRLFFHLQQQKLIELIRAGKVDDALHFAQHELAPRGEENTEFLSELERTITLLAFEDTSKSPMADLLSPAQRQKTASELNAAILENQCQDKDPKLPAVLKLLIWAQEQLKERGVDFPVMDVTTAELSDPSPDQTS